MLAKRNVLAGRRRLAAAAAGAGRVVRHGGVQSKLWIDR